MHKIDFNEDYSSMEKNIVDAAADYVEASGRKALVIGLSGGVDSTVTAALARRVCDRLGVELIGAVLPTNNNKTSETSLGKLAADAFCDRHFVYNLNDIAKKFYIMLTEGKQSSLDDKGAPTLEGMHRLKVRFGNMTARSRMIVLYDIANENEGMVLSTDNLSELLLGFWTLHGDVGDFGMIQNLWKTEIYGLADWLFTEELAMDHSLRAEALFQSARAVPTDGLGVSESDMDQIGAKDYEEVDRRLMDFIKGNATKLDHPVISRHLSSAFKRENPYNLPREVLIK